MLASEVQEQDWRDNLAGKHLPDQCKGLSLDPWNLFQKAGPHSACYHPRHGILGSGDRQLILWASYTDLAGKVPEPVSKKKVEDANISYFCCGKIPWRWQLIEEGVSLGVMATELRGHHVREA